MYLVLLVLLSFGLILAGVYCISTTDVSDDRAIISIVLFVLAIIILIGCGYNFNEIIST